MSLHLLVIIFSSSLVSCELSTTKSIQWDEKFNCGNDTLDPILHCKNDSILIQPCYCMFYEQNERRIIAGTCMSTCFTLNPLYYKEIELYSIQNLTELNSIMCSNLMTCLPNNTHREGRFCGRCKKGYGLAVYSYQYITCIPCQASYKNWLKYFAIALLPLTFFYVFIVLLKINFTSSHLSCSVFTLQCLFSPLQMRIVDIELRYFTDSFSKATILGLVSSIGGIFNLDFFRLMYPPFCLSPDFNILHVVSLDFIVALYPFMLIFITYLLVTMYDRNYRPIVWAWIPFKFCLDRLQRGYNRGSLIQAFASFILLSNVKFLGVCFDLLIPARAYTISGTKMKSKFLYYDATIEYFGHTHWPFAVLAVCIGFAFVLLPFLLMVIYPCRSFQRVLNCLGWRCQTLHIFMDAFQGSYKMEHHDLRYFSGYYLLIRFLILLVTAVTGSIAYVLAILLVLVAAAIIFTVFQPYKCSFHNKVDTVILFSTVLLYVAIATRYMTLFLDRQWLKFPFLVDGTMTFLFFVTIVPILVSLARFLKSHRVLKKMLVCIKNRKSKEASVLINRA